MADPKNVLRGIQEYKENLEASTSQIEAEMEDQRLALARMTQENLTLAAEKRIQEANDKGFRNGIIVGSLATIAIGLLGYGAYQLGRTDNDDSDIVILDGDTGKPSY